jgi:biopolymer transport protein ExbD
MKPWVKDMINENPSMQIAPLIDIVFLLLIYFMVTSSLKKQEADLGITLPGTVSQSAAVMTPDEQIIEIDDQNRVIFNNVFYGNETARQLPDLVATLIRYRLASESMKTKALVTIMAADESLHERTVDVMNACAAAGIKNITFGMGD